MALVLKDRVRETSTTTGTGSFTLGGTSTGFQSFSVIGDGNTTYYGIVNSAAGEWEVGIGTYTSSGTTLSRDTILESSNSGSKVSFGAGSKDVFCTYPAEKAVTLDDVQTLSNKTLTNPVINGFTGNTAVINIGSGHFYKDTSGNVGIGTSSPMRKLHLSSTSNCEQVISQSDAKTDGKNWNFLVDGGNGSTNANFTLRLLNDAGNATPLTGFLINGTTGQRYTPIGFGSTTYSAGDCRVWVKFTGTGTVTIQASMNVSSVGDLGTGRYQVNFAQAMPNTNYAYTFGGKPSTDVIAGYKTDYDQTNTASILYIQTGSATARLDFADVCAAVFL